MNAAAAQKLPPLPAAIHSRLAPVLRFLANLNPAMVQRHHAAAQTFFQNSALWEAEHRWSWVLILRPNHVQALVGLAWVWILKDRLRDATQLLHRALALQPQNPDARYLLATATACQQPESQLPLSTPPRILQRRYTVLAPYYDAQRLVEDGYRVPVEISTRVIRTLGAEMPLPNMLDLGCGTGLLGQVHWRAEARIEGVEAVPAMLSLARNRLRLNEAQRQRMIEIEALRESNPDILMPPELENPRPVYDALWNEDLRDFLLRPRGAMFHAIVASEVFCEVGGLTPIFDGAARNLLPGGVMIFNTDAGPEQGYHAYGKYVRFAHSESYLNELAARVGLSVVSHTIGPRDKTQTTRYTILRKP